MLLGLKITLSALLPLGTEIPASHWEVKTLCWKILIKISIHDENRNSWLPYIVCETILPMICTAFWDVSHYVQFPRNLHLEGHSVQTFVPIPLSKQELGHCTLRRERLGLNGGGKGWIGTELQYMMYKEQTHSIWGYLGQVWIERRKQEKKGKERHVEER